MAIANPMMCQRDAVAVYVRRVVLTNIKTGEHKTDLILSDPSFALEGMNHSIYSTILSISGYRVVDGSGGAATTKPKLMAYVLQNAHVTDLKAELVADLSVAITTLPLVIHEHATLNDSNGKTLVKEPDAYVALALDYGATGADKDIASVSFFITFSKTDCKPYDSSIRPHV